MKAILEAHVPHNTGWSAQIKQGQVIRIIATTTVDFVFFRQANLRERFDQARTKVYNMKLFLSAGDRLMGRDNQHMMTIVHDGFKEGTHDLQKGMCSGYRFKLAQQENRLGEYYPAADQRDSRSRLLRESFQGGGLLRDHSGRPSRARST